MITSLVRRLTGASGAALAISPVLATGLIFPQDLPDPTPLQDPAATRWVEVTGSTIGHTENQRPLGYCTVDTVDKNCSITQIRTYTNTVSADYGVSGEGIAATIGVSQSESIGVSSACNFPHARPGKYYLAIPTQTYFTYRVWARSDNWTEYSASSYGKPPEVSPERTAALYDGGVKCVE